MPQKIFTNSFPGIAFQISIIGRDCWITPSKVCLKDTEEKQTCSCQALHGKTQGSRENASFYLVHFPSKIGHLLKSLSRIINICRPPFSLLYWYFIYAYNHVTFTIQTMSTIALRLFIRGIKEVWYDLFQTAYPRARSGVIWYNLFISKLPATVNRIGKKVNIWWLVSVVRFEMLLQLNQ